MTDEFKSFAKEGRGLQAKRPCATVEINACVVDTYQRGIFFPARA